MQLHSRRYNYTVTDTAKESQIRLHGHRYSYRVTGVDTFATAATSVAEVAQKSINWHQFSKYLSS